MNEQQAKKVEFVRETLISKISEVVATSERLNGKLITEVLISITYLEIFSEYLKKQKFESIEDAWRFMGDIKGIIEKVFYVDNYMQRVIESMNNAGKTA